MITSHLNPARRHEFSIVFDVADGNPNGDPDADNMPRIDPDTGLGKVSDVCLKRKIRDYVALVDGDGRNKIYVESGEPLNAKHERAWTACFPEVSAKKDKEHSNVPEERREALREWMCGEFFDIRTFGAVMSTSVSGGGQVRGPVQITFATSAEPIMPVDNTITRVTPTKETDKKDTEIGHKWTVPYGLYLACGFISAPLAERTGFDAADLELLWAALRNLFEHDRTAARGFMSVRGLYVFSHDSRLGNAPAHELFERVAVTRADGSTGSARAFSDYRVTVAEEMPTGVTLTRIVG